MTETGIQTEFDYCWTAYQVYQMEDGTVYLDGSGNSYGGMGGFTTKVTDTQTKTADGEEEIFSFTAEVTMESVERVTELEVRWYGEEELLDRRTLTMEEVGEGLSLERPQGAVWALVTRGTDWRHRAVCLHSGDGSGRFPPAGPAG